MNKGNETGSSLKIWRNEYARTALIVFFSILINDIGKSIAARYELPLWLDAFGTAFAAYVLGPVCGAIVGLAGNIVFALQNPTSLIYGITNIFIGLSVGYLAKKGYLNTFFRAMSVAGIVTMGSVCISVTLNFIFYSGSTGNVWGDGVKDFLVERGMNAIWGCVIGELYLDFLDKVVTILSLFFIVRLYRLLRKKKILVRGKNTSMLLAGILFTATYAAFPMIVQAKNADKGDMPETSYVQEIIDSDNGLSCGHANDIAQTNDGVLWIGTYAGLYCYNGNQFQLVKEYDSVRNVNCLYVDEEGRLWIGTNDGGVVIAINGKIANVLSSSAGLPSDSVRSIVQSGDGEYYIGTSAGMLVLSLQVGFSNLEEIPDVNYAYQSAADQTGYVAAVTGDGVIKLLKSRQVMASLQLPQSEGRFTCVTFRDDGLLYAGTSEGKVLIYDVGSGSFRKRTEISCEGMTMLNQIYFKDDGVVYLCADNGIGSISEAGTFSKINTGSFSNAVQNMEVDYQGNLWFASTRHGLLRLSRSSFMDIYQEEGFEPTVVNTTELYQDELFIGTDTGLDIIKVKSKKTVENELTALLDGVRIRCIRKDSKEHLWICTYGKGLLELDKTGQITQYGVQEGDAFKNVRVCTELSDGRMAVGCDQGLILIKDGQVRERIPYGEELGFAQILCLWESSDGSLYVGTDGNGVVVVQDGKVEKNIDRSEGLSSGVILRIVPDIEGENLFLVTSNSLCYLNQDGVRVLSAFPYYNNYDICMDDDGEMFVLGSAGIYVLKRADLLNKEQFNYTLLNSRMGLAGSLTVNAWNGLDERKNLYLSTDRGIFVVNLDQYLLDRGSYRLMVSQIRLDDEAYSIERGTELTVARDVKKIEVIPEVVNYTMEDPKVCYYLEGIETTWNTVLQSELSGIVYTNLAAGEYVFHLAILDSKTGGILEESTYTFVKEKSIYDNRWFILYMVFVGGLFVGWLTWFITRTQIQRTLELQQSRLKLALQQVQMGNETILAIARTVDAKDVLTSKHSQRVSEYSVLIAKEIGFTSQEQENLRKAALLHDIGKIGIPDSILNKPAKLTDEEYAVMKTHVTRGAEILKDFTLIDHVVDGAKYHHERYDGHGYPEGLKGEEIPLYGRIIAVADTFDAMTANRVYRKRLDFDYVLSELKRCRGTQFDPRLLDVFLKLLEDGTIDVKALYEEAEDNGQGGDADE